MDTAEVALLPDNPWVARRKITVHDYHEMGKAGILHQDDRVELIEGELVAMAPIGSEHNGAVSWLTHALIRAIGDRGIVLVQGSIRLDDQTEPQPDFSILRPRADFYRHAHATPADVLFLVEIADSSLRYDRSIKRPLYARAGIPEYWIVDLVAARWRSAANRERPTMPTSSRRAGARSSSRRCCRGLRSPSLTCWDNLRA